VFTVNAGKLDAAVSSASRVAPVKGAGYDAAAGIVLKEIGGRLEVRATDLDSTFQERMDAPNIPEGFVARLPHTTLSMLTSTLPKSEDVEISHADGKVIISCGKFSAELNHIVGQYPELAAFEWEGWVGSPVADFANSLKRVAWGAARTGSVPFDGVHFDGSSILTSDKVSFVQYPFVMDIDQPITVPLATLSSVIPKDAVCTVSSDDRLRISAAFGGRKIRLTSNIYSVAFPLMDRVRAWTDDPPATVAVDVDAITTAARRLRSLAPNERYPIVKLTFNGDSLVLEIWQEDVGYVSDVIPMTGDESPLEIWMDPNRLIDVARSVPSDGMLILHQNDPLKPLGFKSDDDSGFLSVSMPMRPGAVGRT